MELCPIKTKREYQAALKEVETLWDAPENSKGMLMQLYQTWN